MPSLLLFVVTIGFGVMAARADDFPERFAFGVGAILCAVAAIKSAR